MIFTTKYIFIFTSFVISSGDTYLDLNLFADRKNDFQMRIVGGEETTIEKYPFMVSVQMNNSHECGGTLYTTDIVLTAAHCCFHFVAFKERREYVKVKVGEMSVLMGTPYSQFSQLPKDGQRRAILFAMPHRHFNFTTMENDIALLKLSFPVVLTGKIKLVPLHFEIPPARPDQGVKCAALGWGHTKSLLPNIPPVVEPSKVLHTVVLSITDDEYCRKYYDQPLGQKLCTHEPNRDVCMGDSGGPLLCSEKMIALSSYAKGCAFEDIPSVFQRIDVQMAWIKNAEIRIMSEAICVRNNCNLWILICIILTLQF